MHDATYRSIGKTKNTTITSQGNRVYMEIGNGDECPDKENLKRKTRIMFGIYTYIHTCIHTYMLHL